MQDTIEKYIACMEEFRMRLDAFWILADEMDQPFESEITVGLMALQLRSALELIAISSFVANKTVFEDAHEQLGAHVKLRNVVYKLAMLHPDFFPQPRRRQKPIEIDGKNHHHADEPPADTPLLNQRELEKAHERCSKSLHSRNPFHPKVDSTSEKEMLKKVAQKTENLMTQHIVHLAGSEEKLFVDLFHGKLRNVHAFQLKPY